MKKFLITTSLLVFGLFTNNAFASHSKLCKRPQHPKVYIDSYTKNDGTLVSAYDRNYLNCATCKK